MTYQDDVVTSGTQQLPILVIDDVKSARAVLCDMLNDLGFRECLEAQDGFEALEILRRTPVQLILCDFVMEGMNGIEFLHELSTSDIENSAPVIFVSALGDVASVEAAMKLGATDYLVKPVGFRKFRRKIESVLGIRLPDAEGSAVNASATTNLDENKKRALPAN
ncbi:MAG: response regulator [Pseudomonadota bacterium]|jgi:two-component system chemotaxis response regulator CheY